VRRCSYCDFAIAVRKRIPAREFVDTIQRELMSLGWVIPAAMPWGSKEPLETVYLGGGTPSLLGAEALAALLAGVLGEAGRNGPEDREVTLEANPEDVTPEAARAWRRAGVNRISLGAQSFDDSVLQWMHRTHDAARIGDAVRALRGAGFDNISLDLIFGLPEELRRDWGRDLDRACALGPEHLSLYGLTVEQRTPLARWISRGATRPPDDERYAAEYLAAHERLARDGYGFYEVSNAARGGARSRHNSAYWSGRPYLGAGPAAHSFDGRVRRWNHGAWEAYRRAVLEGRSPVESQEVLTPEQQGTERVYLALRTSEGLALTGADVGAPLPAWVEQGWAVVRGDRLTLTSEGWLRLDALAADLTGVRAIL
jgi:oxygen-independent coproporphyrinogen-3 oxidase